MRESSSVVRPEDAPSKLALLRSALRLFVRDGLCETSIRAVADDAGFTNPALFKFFRGRDELAAVVFERCYERLAQAVEAAASVDGFEPRLRAIVQAAARFMDEELDAFLYVTEQLRRFWPGVSPALRRRSIVRMLGELFALGVDDGKVARDHDPALLVTATIGCLSQVGRALYFKEVAGPALRRAPELERMLLRLAW